MCIGDIVKPVYVEDIETLNAEIGILFHTLTQRENEEEDDEDDDESIEKLRYSKTCVCRGY